MSIAIRTEHLSKEYRLGTINRGMLFRDIQSWMARKRGKPDPHEKIGAAHFEDQVDRFWALKDISFDIEQGDRVGIIGRNGAGKSTLLKILSRITAPTEGRAKIRGRVASLLEVGTGFNGELTGRENIFLNGAIMGMKRREVSRKMDEIIAFSGIEHHIDTPVKRYSSGMYVRLAFSVAAHLDSDILIADEVLAVGDAAFQNTALGKMKELSRGQGRTVLFVSHNLGAARSLCGSGIILDKGSIVGSGEIDGIIAKYQSAIGIGTCTRVQWDNRKNLEICILEVCVNNDKNEEPLTGPGTFVSIKYQVNRRSLSSHIDIRFRKEGMILFRSWDIDSTPEKIIDRQPGIYMAKFYLPEILVAGHYTIDVASSQRGIGYIDLHEECVAFELHTTDSQYQKRSHSRGAAFIYNRQWEISKIG
jgi:lipopolysaccharide transport system ATP-binding protein